MSQSVSLCWSSWWFLCSAEKEEDDNVETQPVYAFGIYEKMFKKIWQTEELHANGLIAPTHI